MEFKDKLQRLRTERGLTQQELAGKLFVSRTAISKWESGRGYPSIDSLKAIAAFFSVTVDQLISTDEVLTAAEGDKRSHAADLITGVMDICALLLIVLPVFADRSGNAVRSVSLLSLSSVNPIVTVAYFVAIILTGLCGAVALFGRKFKPPYRAELIRWISLASSLACLLLLVLSLHPYAAVYMLALISVKLAVLRWQ